MSALPNESQIYEIPVYNVPVFVEKIAKINKRGSKIGAEPIVIYSVGDPYATVFNPGSNNEFVIDMQQIVFTGSAPKLNGWTLVDVVEPYENGVMIRKFPGIELEVPVEYRNVTPDRCDHCHTRRQRNETFIVYHPVNGWKVVGRTCLADFTGIHNPERVADFASVLYDLTKEMETSASGGSGSGHAYHRAPIRSFLYMVALYVIRYGYVTSKQAKERYREDGYMPIDPTGYRVFHDHFMGVYSRITGKDATAFHSSITDEENQRATELSEAAMEYGKTAFVDRADESLNDFGHNMKLILGGDYVRDKDAGYVASLIPIYMRTLEKNRTDYSQSGFLGEIGDKLVLPVTITSVFPWEGNYGVVNITNMIDDRGNILTWFAPSDRVMNVGDYKVLTCKVKKHSDRNGQKSTVISYPKFA
jgi:hypothetical protein